MTEPTQTQILSNLMYHYPRYMHLKMFVDGNAELRARYVNKLKEHNARLMDNAFIDAGVDLFVPADNFCMSEDAQYPKAQTMRVDHQVKCAARLVSVYPTGETRSYNTGFYIHPRSSIYKTPLRLANSAGVIDAGYRGNLIAIFDVINRPHGANIMAGDRLVQICAPDLVPIYVELVDSVEDLGEKTARAEGGFGSTGR